MSDEQLDVFALIDSALNRSAEAQDKMKGIR